VLCAGKCIAVDQSIKAVLANVHEIHWNILGEKPYTSV